MPEGKEKTKVYDWALVCRHDFFDKLVDYAEPRHKEWNMVFANCLRQMNDQIKEINAAIKRLEGGPRLK